MRPLWAVPALGPRNDDRKHFVDFQNDVTAADIGLAAREAEQGIGVDPVRVVQGHDRDVARLEEGRLAEVRIAGRTDADQRAPGAAGALEPGRQILERALVALVLKPIDQPPGAGRVGS